MKIIFRNLFYTYGDEFLRTDSKEEKKNTFWLMCYGRSVDAYYTSSRASSITKARVNFEQSGSEHQDT
ncbi:hypothetical protein PGT21_010087 [Puccinia graminis f. sp. tritici]|uniref:Uncharacterized protein n=1 Tax=Puccinia graminis f. sp. tritici TaxID=56615 RepID=A0A5B0N268_PUCGR|nr:hypothetical protein PGT21_010087 [Puccinia graminis f. sp. tritici]KAA1133429.1 hypothetical protein PGTUg99_008501 [Puccinia graminis f. sp. tritici]